MPVTKKPNKRTSRKKLNSEEQSQSDRDTEGKKLQISSMSFLLEKFVLRFFGVFMRK